MLLLGAAGLKIGEPDASSLVAWTGLTIVWSNVFAVLYELLLAGWLLTGVCCHGALLATLVTFCCFAGVAAVAGFAGHASCGCFGGLSINPWRMFGVDLGVAVCSALAVVYDRASLREVVRGCVTFAIRVSAAVAGWTVLAVGLFGTSDAMLAYLAGHRVLPDRSVVETGSLESGRPVRAVATLRNTTTRPVTVVGGSSSCGGSFAADLPLTLPPGGVAELTIWVAPPVGRGRFVHHGLLWTDADGRRTIPVAVAGWVVQWSAPDARASNEVSDLSCSRGLWAHGRPGR